MRLYCCGKAVTGIGNVPKWEPVSRGGDKQLVVPAEGTADGDEGGAEGQEGGDA